ncbi:glycosyltransferase [Neorhodopirellula lusitana]|nr:glycosyltransferase [Neorhodopirellula lusitana]
MSDFPPQISDLSGNRSDASKPNDKLADVPMRGEPLPGAGNAIRPLRMACVIHSLDGGGAERVMAGLASRLADRGHEVTLMTLDDGRADRHKVSGRVQRTPLSVLSTAQRPVSLWKRLVAIRRAIRGGEYQVVLSFCDWTNVLTLLATIGLRGCPPIVVSERSDPARQSLGPVREWLRRRVYRRAAAVVCLSSDVAATLTRMTGVTPIVIGSAVEEVAPAEPVAPTDGEPLRLIAMGRLEHEKGFDRLLRAVVELQMVQGVPDWRLAILGDGSEAEPLRLLAQELGVADRVEFMGWVSPVSSCLQASDVFVLPSRYEGFPSAMLEAMAAGVAVVAVDAGGSVRDTIRHGENGWLVKNQVESLTEGLSHVLIDTKLRQQMASNGPDTARQFSWPRMVDAYEGVLKLAAQSQ